MNRAGYQSTSEQRQAIEDQFARFALALSVAEPRDLPRTYGFEIETPSADRLRETALDDLRADGASWSEAHNALSECLDWKQDGSVTGSNQNEECECDCRSCVYHDCDCDDCEMNNNGEPDHDCGSGDCYNGTEFQEITSIGGTTTTHPQSLDILKHAGLEFAEINDTCGLHIHIGSADLEPAQVAQVISAYRVIQQLINPIAERSGVYYAQENSDDDLALARTGYATQKYRAVNTATHFHTGNYRPKTIEFRQHAGTNSVASIRAWAVLLVALVEYAKRNSPVYWLARCADFDELAKELRLSV